MILVVALPKNSLWYLDTDNTSATTNTGYQARKVLMTDANVLKDVNVIIPLNRYSFFEELHERMLVPMQLEFNIELQNDNELIFKAGAADDGRVVINRFLLWVPRLLPKDSLFDKFVNSFMQEQTWT